MPTCGHVFCSTCKPNLGEQEIMTRCNVHHVCAIQKINRDKGLDIINIVDAELCDEYIFVADQGREHVKVISATGESLEEFDVDEGFGLIKAVKVFKKHLYICQAKAVTVQTFDKEKPYKPYKILEKDIVLSFIIVISSGVVLVSDEVKGTIWHLDLMTKQINPIISGLDTPRYMSWGDDKLAVSCSGIFKNKPCINIYDSSWQPIACLKLELIPWGIVFLPSGNILVSLKKCICEYSLNGGHVRCVLEEKDGINQESNIKLYDGKLFVLELDIHGKAKNETRGFKYYLL